MDVADYFCMAVHYPTIDSQDYSLAMIHTLQETTVDSFLTVKPSGRVVSKGFFRW